MPASRDPVAIIGVVSILFPFIFVLIAIGTGAIDTSVYRYGLLTVHEGHSQSQRHNCRRGLQMRLAVGPWRPAMWQAVGDQACPRTASCVVQQEHAFVWDVLLQHCVHGESSEVKGDPVPARVTFPDAMLCIWLLMPDCLPRR
eukprot:365346-Chlamydomonas_euryale.AAC.14